MAGIKAPPKIMTRSRAWGCVGLNQLAFPGLGTITAGSKIGYVQAAVMVIGFSFFVGFMVGFSWLFTRVIAGETSDVAIGEYFRAWQWLLWGGLGLSAFSWIWALVSSISILNSVARNQ